MTIFTTLLLSKAARSRSASLHGSQAKSFFVKRKCVCVFNSSLFAGWAKTRRKSCESFFLSPKQTQLFFLPRVLCRVCSLVRLQHATHRWFVTWSIGEEIFVAIIFSLCSYLLFCLSCSPTHSSVLSEFFFLHLHAKYLSTLRGGRGGGGKGISQVRIVGSSLMLHGTWRNYRNFSSLNISLMLEDGEKSSRRRQMPCNNELSYRFPSPR